MSRSFSIGYTPVKLKDPPEVYVIEIGLSIMKLDKARALYIDKRMVSETADHWQMFNMITLNIKIYLQI